MKNNEVEEEKETYSSVWFLIVLFLYHVSIFAILGKVLRMAPRVLHHPFVLRLPNRTHCYQLSDE